MGAAPSSSLDKLVAIATLGTRRAPPPKEFEWPDPALAPLGSLDQAAETRLLRAAAAFSLFDAAGTRAAPAATSGASADFPDQGGRVVNAAAAWRLARIISGDHRELLGEWLALAAAANRVLPAHLLPVVLEHVPAEERRGAATVLGPAATWLAARHEGWLAEAPVTEPSDLQWKEGTLAERLAELEAARRVDRVRSIAWLRSTWNEDPPEAREAFLRALLPTIGPEDEAFLESALDDRRKPVRQAAAEALARLPSSAFAQRNLQRLEGLVKLGPAPSGLLGKMRRRTLEIGLPAAPDKSAQRDGIELKVPAHRKIGERAFWLVQMFARVPPRHWCERSGCDPAAWIDALLASDYADDLFDALTEAAARHPQREWSLLLASRWLDSKRDFARVMEALQSLVAGAPADGRLVLAERVLEEATTENFGLASHVLDTLDVPWSAALTHAAFDRLEPLAQGDRSNYSQPRNRLDAWARRCDVDIGARRAAVLLEKLGGEHSWRNALERCNDIVAFRAAMQEELKT